MQPEVPSYQSPHKLRRLLIQRINHLSDQLSVETLRLFQALLQLSYQPILDTLIVRNFQQRNYLDWNKVRKSRLPISRTASIASKSSLNTSFNTGKIEGKDNDKIDENPSPIDLENNLIEINRNGSEIVTLEENKSLDSSESSETDNKVDNVENKENIGSTDEVNDEDENKNKQSDKDENKNKQSNSDEIVVNNEQCEADDTEKAGSSNESFLVEQDQAEIETKHDNGDTPEVAEEALDDDLDDEMDGCVITFELNPKQDQKSKSKTKKKDKELGEELQQQSPVENLDVSFADSPLQAEENSLRNGFIKKKIEKAVNG